MAVSSKAGTTAIFDLKSAALSVLALRLKTADLDTLSEALQQQFGATPGMFEHEPLCLDLGLLPPESPAPDFAALLPLLRGHGFNPVAVQGAASAEVLALAQAAGLAEAALAQGPRPAPRTAPLDTAHENAQAATHAGAHAEPDDTGETLNEWPDTVPPDLFAAAEAAAAGEAASAAGPAQGALPLAPPAEPMPVPAPVPVPEPAPALAIPALVIDKPLRSGQRVYARGSDLVVLAVVSHGAEVIADGSIHVYAPLRGRALAGAKGDATARIFAVRMEAQLVSIAGVWRTTEAGLPADVAAQPAQVRLEGERLLFEPLKF